ncbi:MAG: diguanylate cyclase [Bacillota bacterium]
MNIGFDALTNVWDRETIISYVEQRLKKNQFFYIALGDVDFFLNIDSKVGSCEGDKILQRIASFFKESGINHFGRYGGDEFLIFLETDEVQQAVQTMEEIRRLFRKQRFIDKDSIYGKVPMTMSFGLAYCNNIDCINTLLKKAEIALAMAKKRGRNQVAVAADEEINILSNHTAGVSTIVGEKLRGYSGDLEPACKARILEPYGVDLTPENEVVFADRGNHRIRKICNDGRIVTIAGNGTYGYSGDGREATAASLNKPSGVAVDKQGCIYIADTGNHCIRKVDRDNIITTIAGCGIDGYDGDGAMAVSAKLSRPGGVVVDLHGNVYTNDYGNNVIRMISNTGYISTIAGTGEFGYLGDGGSPLDAAFDRPYGLAVVPDGSIIYVADYGNHCIREINMKEHVIKTISGTGQPGYAGDGNAANKAMLDGPFWVTALQGKYLLIADANNHCIRMINLETSMIETLVGNGKPGYFDVMNSIERSRYNIPAGMVMDTINKVLYIADYGNNAIRKVNMSQYKV